MPPCPSLQAGESRFLRRPRRERERSGEQSVGTDPGLYSVALPGEHDPCGIGLPEPGAAPAVPGSRAVPAPRPGTWRLPCAPEPVRRRAGRARCPGTARRPPLQSRAALPRRARPLPRPGGAFTLTASSTSATAVRLTWSPPPGATASTGVLVSRASGPMVPRSRPRQPEHDHGGHRRSADGQSVYVPGGGAGCHGHRAGPLQSGADHRHAAARARPDCAGSFPIAPTYVATPYVPTGGLSTVWPPPSAGGALRLVVLRAAPRRRDRSPRPASPRPSPNASEPGSANVQWTPLPNAVSYSVWASLGGGQLQAVVPTTANAAAFVPNLPAGQYTFQVHAQATPAGTMSGCPTRSA